MLTPRENCMAILNRQQPDYYGDVMHCVEFIPDPAMMRDMCPQDGKEHIDSWGVTYIWPAGAPGAHPPVTPENAVIKDIEKWEEQVKFPSLDDLDWWGSEYRNRQQPTAVSLCNVLVYLFP